MGLTANQARLNVLTARKSDVEYRLTILSTRQLQLATLQAQAVADKSNALSVFNADETKDTNASFENTQAYADYEQAMAQIEAAQTRLDLEQKKTETENQAIKAEEEEVKKLVENNIKKSFGYFN